VPSLIAWDCKGVIPPLVILISLAILFRLTIARGLLCAPRSNRALGARQVFNIATGIRHRLGENREWACPLQYTGKNQSSDPCRIAGGISRIGLAILTWLTKNWAVTHGTVSQGRASAHCRMERFCRLASPFRYIATEPERLSAIIACYKDEQAIPSCRSA